MKRPVTIRNEAKWIADCRKIHARSNDLLEGRISLFAASQELNKLSIWVDAKDDADLSVFKIVYGEFVGIAAGSERKHWVPHALAREDLKIRNLEAIWLSKAIAAAKRLVDDMRGAWRPGQLFVEAAVQKRR